MREFAMKSKYSLGTNYVPRPKHWRLASYLRGLGWFVAAVAAVAGMLALVQIFWHPFDLVIETAEKGFSLADMTLTHDALGGISTGSLVLVGLVAAIPLLKKGVRRRQYGVSFWRGILSSAIFLATDKLYRYVQGLGVLYFSATLALFIALTIVFVEIVSRVGAPGDEADTRTELLASIVSGLVFGLLVQVAEYAIGAIGKML
jgi:hypothetical protein